MKRKPKWEIAIDVLGLIIGIILFVCGIQKKIPGFSNDFFEIISWLVAYGVFLGPSFILIAISDLIID